MPLARTNTLPLPAIDSSAADTASVKGAQVSHPVRRCLSGTVTFTSFWGYDRKL